MEGRNGHCRLYRGLVTVPAPFWNPLQESGRSSSHLRVTITVTVLLPLDRTLFPRPVPTPSVCGVTGGAGSLAWCHPCPRRPTPAPRSLSGHRSCRQAGGGGRDGDGQFASQRLVEQSFWSFHHRGQFAYHPFIMQDWVSTSPR